MKTEVEQLRESIAATRIQLQQALEERDAMKYELDSWRVTFHHAADEELKAHGGFVMRVWLSCLDEHCAPKSHLIDGLAKTTRRLRQLQPVTP